MEDIGIKIEIKKVPPVNRYFEGIVLSSHTNISQWIVKFLPENILCMTTFWHSPLIRVPPDFRFVEGFSLNF